MFAKSLCLKNFRNISNQQLIFNSGVNIICGENAMGKTNVIEGLWLFSSGKSFRATREKEVISFNQDNSNLKLNFFANNRDNKFEIDLFRHTKKSINLNGVKIKKLSEIVGVFTSVLFSPEHLTLVKDGPSERRRFIDIALCQLKPKYLSLLSEYNKLLEQKNAALKKAYTNSSIIDTLDIWNEKIAIIGSEIICFRALFINELLEFAKIIHNELSDGLEILSLKYLWFSDLSATNHNEVYSTYKQKQKQLRHLELKEGITLCGPHRDDIDICLNGLSVRLYGSQGQQRSCVLSLKLAEAELIYKEYNEYPLLLLDDVLSELDHKRQEYIVEKIKDKQVIITCCDIEKLNNLKIGKVFYVANGVIN